MDSKCLPVEMLESMKESSEDIDCHLYYCIKCFRLTEQVNAAYIEAFEAEEREVDEGNRKRLAESGKAEFLLLLGVLGAPHLNEKEVVNFNLSPEVFEPEIRHYLFDHLADCFCLGGTMQESFI